MTEGRYCRVWTPLGEPALRVDDDRQRDLPIELLSTGAREQLFLALRLALIARYAREGKSLPLVLDDVLVNFDTRRARAAATMLVRFATAGHQMLLFTCHEHIAELFKSLECDVRQLPGSTDGEPKVVGPDIHKHVAPAEAPRRRRERRAKEAPPMIEAVFEPAGNAKLETNELLAAAPPTPAIVSDTQLFRAVPEATPSIAAAASHSDPARFHRADPPQRIAPARIDARRQRWSAEEFDGELADQVNAALARAALDDGK
jgi:hypothetical protein